MTKETNEEKYLTVQLLGKNGIRVNAFLNKNRSSDKEPLFTGDGVAVWVNKKKPKQEDNSDLI